MKKIGIFFVIVFVATYFASIANATATDSSSKNEGILVNINPDNPATGDSTADTNTSQAKNFWQIFFWRPSPAGCSGNPTHAHPSNYHPGKIGYRVVVICNLYVSEIKIEVWGDRSSWSGWRQHTDGHYVDSEYNVNEFRLSQHKTGLSGTYNYRTRGKAWSVENGTTYYTNLSGDSKRITCSSTSTGFHCVWAS